jgi:hypothetical protein
MSTCAHDYGYCISGTRWQEGQRCRVARPLRTPALHPHSRPVDRCVSCILDWYFLHWMLLGYQCAPQPCCHVIFLPQRNESMCCRPDARQSALKASIHVSQTIFSVCSAAIARRCIYNVDAWMKTLVFQNALLWRFKTSSVFWILWMQQRAPLTPLNPRGCQLKCLMAPNSAFWAPPPQARARHSAAAPA